MHFEGTSEVKAIRALVFDLVLDPQRFSSCVPNLQKLDVKSKDEFVVVARAGISFIKGDFTMHFTVSEKEPPSHVKLLGHGTGIGSTLDLEATMDFSESDAGTLMKWQAEAKVRGRIATFGERLLMGQAEKFVSHLFGCLGKKVEQGSQ